MKKVLIILLITVLILGSIGISVYVDIANNDVIKKIPSRPEESLNTDINGVLWALESGEEPDYDAVYGSCRYVEGRYDCSDFRIQSMLRLLYDHEDKLPEEVKDTIKDTLLGFKYWMDQPGEDSMCFWSENHQILFSTSEYLIGQLYPNEIFTNDGKTGHEHMEIAKKRILIWLEQRWLYGFTEWYSNVYYVEDIAPISNLIDFAGDEEIKIKAQIIMDLLLYDLATQSYKGTFVSTSGRAYERNKKSGHGSSMKAVSEHVFGYDLGGSDRKGMDLNFIYINDYEVPEVIRKIGLDTSEIIIRASNGLNVSELKGEGLIGQKDSQIMMQWAMEAFTNPEVISNSIKYISKHNMFSNEFLNDFKMINIGLLKNLGLLPTVSRMLNPVTNGVAIQRANTYTYKNNSYMLSTAQSYHPGSLGDQQHIWSATLSNDVSIFTTHPAKPLSDKGALSGSPGYWVGSGRLPHSVQDENINLSIYVIPDKKAFLEDTLVLYTHAYFPSEKLDEVIIDNNYAFGRLRNTYIALIGKNDLSYYENTTDDLIQNGQVTYWITELSTGESETFIEFIDRIQSNAVSFNEKKHHLVYESNNKKIELEFQKDFMVNDEEMDTEYKRFDSPYAYEVRKPETIEIKYGKKKLFLDFYNLERLIIN